jgi:ectoine hydroxylase-related dioxygenase (phytanoyl-CoA dioxygenase family)
VTRTDSTQAALPVLAIERHLHELDLRGFTVVPDVLSPDRVQTTLVELDRLLGRHRGRNDFEGFQTERVYTLINHGKIFEDICEHPAFTALLDRLLAPGYLLSVTQAIAMMPGETAQDFHRDDGYYLAASSDKLHSVSTMIALDPFTDINGATEMVAGSNRWTRAQTDALRKSEPAVLADAIGALKVIEMAPGSCAVWVGATMHRGGANRSDAVRRAITNQYCNPWLRPQETFLLSVPREKARAMSPRLQTMLGYDILPPFMGHLTGLHPGRVLRDEPS